LFTVDCGRLKDTGGSLPLVDRSVIFRGCGKTSLVGQVQCKVGDGRGREELTDDE
jgi:hypothetical protein